MTSGPTGHCPSVCSHSTSERTDPISNPCEAQLQERDVQIRIQTHLNFTFLAACDAPARGRAVFAHSKLPALFGQARAPFPGQGNTEPGTSSLPSVHTRCRSLGPCAEQSRIWGREQSVCFQTVGSVTQGDPSPFPAPAHPTSVSPISPGDE